MNAAAAASETASANKSLTLRRDQPDDTTSSFSAPLTALGSMQNEPKNTATIGRAQRPVCRQIVAGFTVLIGLWLRPPVGRQRRVGRHSIPERTLKVENVKPPKPPADPGTL